VPAIKHNIFMYAILYPSANEKLYYFLGHSTNITEITEEERIIWGGKQIAL
jgi:hypothetical protein